MSLTFISCEELRQAEDQYPLLTDRSLVLQGEIKVISEEISRLSQGPPHETAG